MSSCIEIYSSASPSLRQKACNTFEHLCSPSAQRAREHDAGNRGRGTGQPEANWHGKQLPLHRGLQLKQLLQLLLRTGIRSAPLPSFILRLLVFGKRKPFSSYEKTSSVHTWRGDSKDVVLLLLFLGFGFLFCR